MADRLALPRPAFLQQVVGAFDVLRGVAQAKPLGHDPVALASPEEEGAPPRTGDGEVYSRAYGGFSIDPRWLNELALNEDTVLRNEGGQDLKLFDAILDDPTCQSAFQQRRLAVISKPWEVDAGDDSAKSKAAADHLRQQLKNIPWDRICDRMLYALWYGFGVGELMLDYGPDGKVWLTDILIPDRKWFGFTNAGELRLKSAENNQEALPPNKFWAIRSGASHDFAPYGLGLAHWCYWPVWFKKNAIKFWAIYLEKFGMPTALGKFPEGATDDTRNNLLGAAEAVGRDSAVIVPETAELQLLEAGRASESTYLQFCNQMDDYLLRVVLSQTGTSKSEAQGLGGSQSDVMKDVRDEVVAADSDVLHESFNRTVAAWLTAWNFGPDVAPPRVYRNLEPEEDLDAQAERDTKLKALGWVRTKESFTEVYGDGYEKQEPPTPPPGFEQGGQPGAPPAPGQDQPGNVIDMNRERARRAAQFAAFAANGPQPLYVSRKLEAGSARELLAWARKAGIPNLEPAEELHVTILYSRQPVDWFDMGSDWTSDPAGRLRIPKGGPRAIVKFGDSCIVLRFASNDLQWRHESMVEKGASHDFDEYAPHVTLTTDGADFDAEAVQEAFQGELIFGPEIFEPVKEEIPDLETVFSADQLDSIDRWSAALARESEPMLAEFAASLKGKLKGVENSAQLRVILLDALERFPAERLGELAGLSFTAARAAAAAGESDSLAV